MEESDNPSHNHNEEGTINRKTRHGFGVPIEDMFMFKGKVTYGKISKKWKCLICNYQRGRHGRHRVFGHVASTHGYQSRIKNDRWNIPEEERHREETVINRPENIDIYMAQEISYGNIELEMIGEFCIFKCLKCTSLPIFKI